MIQVYIKRTFPSGDWYWWPVCTVWDNEALGFIERQLEAAGFEVRVQEEVTFP